MNRLFACALLPIVLFGTQPSLAEEVPWSQVSFFQEICDIRTGAPISGKCYGFVLALMQTNEIHYRPAPNPEEACFPSGTTVDQVVVKMRPWFRKSREICVGSCSAADSVLNAMHKIYPCK